MKFSIRTALIAILFMSVGCWTLICAGQASNFVLSTATLLAFMAIAIIACVGSGKNRAMSIGFVLCSLIYGVLVMLPGQEPLDPLNTWDNRLPTTLVMKPVFQVCQRTRYMDGATGKLLPNYVPKPNEQFMTGSGYFNGGGGGGGFGGAAGVGGFGGGAAKTIRTFTPDQSAFMFNAHLLWTTFFGIFGALVASYVWKSGKSDAA